MLRPNEQNGGQSRSDSVSTETGYAPSVNGNYLRIERMPFNINFYQDQILAGGATSTPLGPLPRLLWVRDGEVAVNGRDLRAGESAAASEGYEVEGTARVVAGLALGGRSTQQAPHPAGGCRRAHDPPYEPAHHVAGHGSGSEWLFRLDQITSRAGHVSDPHIHPGPGIRCLLRGTFNIEQLGERYRGGSPGEPWWESGGDEVVFWGSETMGASFLRGMVLPVDHAGSATGKSSTADPNRRSASWTLHVDELFTVPDSDR